MYIWIHIFFHHGTLGKWIQFGMNIICVKHAGDFNKSPPRRATTPSWRNTGQLRVPWQHHLFAPSNPLNQTHLNIRKTKVPNTPQIPPKNLPKDFRSRNGWSKKRTPETSKNSRMNSQTETVGRNWVIKDEHHPELRDCCR